MFSKHFLLLTNSLETLKEVFLRECVSYFSCYEDRIHDRSNVLGLTVQNIQLPPVVKQDWGSLSL